MLLLHILAGFIGLFVAPAALLSRKGSSWHRRWGWIYVASMGVVGSTAIVLALSPLNVFLLIVAVFSTYMAYSGACALGQRRTRTIHVVDWLMATLVVLSCLLLIGHGLMNMLQSDSFGLVAIAFGGLGVWLAGSDLAFYLRPDFSPATVYQRHLRMMIGSYIAMVSAFSAVNLLFLPPLVRWLWPTLLGSLLIALWSRNIARRFSAKQQVAASNTILSSTDDSLPRNDAHRP